MRHEGALVFPSRAVFRRWPFSAFGLLVVGCAGATGGASQRDFSLHAAPVSYVSMSDTIPPDLETDALVSPYHAQLIDATSRVIGMAVAQFDKGRPEGSLGNLVTDAMLHIVQSLVQDTVRMAIANNGGLRVPVLPGPITVGEIFELAPFENYLTVVELTGTELKVLAGEIAQIGGEPVAGFSFHIDGATGRAGDVRVRGEPVVADRVYRVVTLDYLVDGGGFMRTLWSARPRVTTDVLLREAIIRYIELRGEIRPLLDDRIIRVER